MKTTHTAGNWTAKEVKQNDRDPVFWESEVIANNTIRIAKIAGVGKEIAEANARLIANAPKMKDALQMVADYWDSDLSEAEKILKSRIEELLSEING